MRLHANRTTLSCSQRKQGCFDLSAMFVPIAVIIREEPRRGNVLPRRDESYEGWRKTLEIGFRRCCPGCHVSTTGGDQDSCQDHEGFIVHLCVLVRVRLVSISFAFNIAAHKLAG